MKTTILILTVFAQPAAWTQALQQPATASTGITASWSTGSRNVATMPIGQAGPVVGKPLSATEVYRSTQLLADGTRVDHTDTSLFFRDDRGRMRTESQGTITIFDPVAGFSYLMRPATKTYTQAPTGNPNLWTWVSATGTDASVKPSAAHQEAGDPAVTIAQRRFGLPVLTPVTETLPAQSINGIIAIGSRVTITIPKGALGNDRDMKVVNERWYSDGFKVLVKSVNSDPRYGVTTYELTQLVQGSPPSALFQVSAEYKLRSPL